MSVAVILAWPAWSAVAAVTCVALAAVIAVYRRELDHTPTPPPEAAVTPVGFYLEPLEQDS